MNFLLHIDPETGAKHLFPNKTNTPKDKLADCTEIEIDTSKDGLIAAFNELFEQIPTQTAQEPAQEREDAVQPPATADVVSLPSEGPLDGQQNLTLYRLIEQRWPELPMSFKLDLTGSLWEEIREVWPSKKEPS